LIKWQILNQLLSNQPIKEREDLDVEEEEAVEAEEAVVAEVVDVEVEVVEDVVERMKTLDNGSQSPSLVDLFLTR